MPRPKERVISSLKSKGFVQTPGDHIRMVYYTKDGQKTNVKTMTSHTPKMRDISDPLISAMARQCRLSKGEFLNLVDCPLSRDDLEGILRERGEI